MNFYNFWEVFALKKNGRLPSPSLESPALFLSLSSCSSRSSTSRSSSRTTTAAAAGVIYSSSSSRAPYLPRRRSGCKQGYILRQNMPCYLAWYAVSAGNIRNNTIVISNGARSLYFHPERMSEQIRDVWLASSGTVIAVWNRARLVNARRGSGLPDLEGSGLQISVATRPAWTERGWLGMGRLAPP